jgi:hypothetical protein
VSKDSLRLKPLWHRHRGSNPVISQPVLLMRLWKQWHSHPSRTLFGFRGESDISRIQFSPFVDLPALGSPWSHLSVFWNCTWPKPPETLLHETNRNLVTIILPLSWQYWMCFKSHDKEIGSSAPLPRPSRRRRCTEVEKGREWET